MNEVEIVLDELCWKEDQAVINPFGEHVWLKPHFVDGQRTGITDCCFVDDPCEHHQRLANETSN
jgi:hypothetical protein